MQDTPAPATRQEALRRLEAFLPRAGLDYARERNHDRGPGDRGNVSTLSPWIRHRLVLEEEVVAAVLERHSLSVADKFLQEVCWRTYWKGWLELRPGIWTRYLDDVDHQVRRLEDEPALRDRWEQATTGRAGIACFDAWCRELLETGYLHNHARMWFASIWIFTLELPWSLGADFFLRYLLDGDPASNTLSWRWVAGLQTRGKTYLARAANIAQYTDGRFNPTERLAHEARALQESPPPLPRPLPALAAPDRTLSTGLLLTEEDLSPELLDFQSGGIPLRAIASLDSTDQRSSLPVGPLPLAFARAAMADARARASAHFQQAAAKLRTGPEADWLESLLDWCHSHRLAQVITPHAPVGATQSRLTRAALGLREQGIRLVSVRRTWDGTLWPLATRGFFAFKEQLPGYLQRLM